MVNIDPKLDETSALLGVTSRQQNPTYDGAQYHTVSDDLPDPSLWKCITMVAALSIVAFVSSMVTGLLTVAMPEMALDLHIEENMLLW